MAHNNPGLHGYGSAPDAPTAMGIAAGDALERYFNRITDFGSQALDLGPKPAQGAFFGITVQVGRIATTEGGEFHSKQRADMEEGVLDAVYAWHRALGGGQRGGWFLVYAWRSRGGPGAELELHAGEGTPMPPPAQRVFNDWGDTQTFRLNALSAPGGVWVAPCQYRGARKAVHHVTVALRGLPDRYALRGTVDAIFRGVGYAGGLKIVDTFYGRDPRRPTMSDGSVCAVVVPPPSDRTLARLPPTLYLGGCQENLVQVYVSTRSASAARLLSHRPPPQQPPPPPARPPSWAEAVRAAAPAAPAGAAAAAAPAPRQAAPARAAAPGPARAFAPARGAATAGRHAAGSATAAPAAAAASMSVDSQPDGMQVDSGPSRPPAAAQVQPSAFRDVTAARTMAIKRALLEWSTSAFPSADEQPGEAQRLLDQLLAQPGAATAVNSWARQRGELQLDLPPPDVVTALVAWFGGVHGLRRCSAYADGGSASSSEGGGQPQQAGQPGPAAAAAAAAAAAGRRPGPAQRRSSRANLGRPPGPESLARGAPLPAPGGREGRRPAGGTAPAGSASSSGPRARSRSRASRSRSADRA